MTMNSGLADKQYGDHHGHIDGLRGIAVALVILFHFEIGGAKNGFLGIDIFFVLSGFLVGGQIIHKAENGTFSLLSFFRRRIARIFPAFLFVSAIALFFGYFILLPDDFVRLANSIFAAMTLNANNFYYFNSDYFSPSAQDWYFLHTWTLSVEEQFYIIFPIAILLLTRLRLSVERTVGATIAASLAVQFWLASRGSIGAYYFLSARVWEMLAGVAVMFLFRRGTLPLRFAGAAASFGLVLAVAPSFIPEYGGIFLSAGLQVICVFGACLLVLGNLTAPMGWPARALASSPLRGLGHISYSLYLIHWPLLTMAAYWAVEPLGTAAHAGLALLSLVLSIVSWRCIEVPFRNYARRNPQRSVAIIATGLGSAFLCLVLCSTIVAQHGFPKRLNPAETSMLASKNDFSPRRRECHSDQAVRPIAPQKSCALGAAAEAPTFAVWSDSHGVELSYALGERLRQRRMALLQMTSSSCPPVMDYASPDTAACPARNRDVLTFLQQSPRIKTVILTMAMAYPLTDRRTIRDGWEKTVAALTRMNKNVVIVGPVPRPPFNVPRAMTLISLNERTDIAPSMPLSRYLDARAMAMADLISISEKYGATLVDPRNGLCGASACPYRDKNRALYFDDNHLSLTGARQLAPIVIP